MFISILKLFKIGIGPSSSHTMGPMTAANQFLKELKNNPKHQQKNTHIQVTLKGSLAYTGKGHSTDKAVIVGLHGYQPTDLVTTNVKELLSVLKTKKSIENDNHIIGFCPNDGIIFDMTEPLPAHPNGIIFELLNQDNKVLYSNTYFSIGGGFIVTHDQMKSSKEIEEEEPDNNIPYGFSSASEMLEMSEKNGLSIAQMKRANELTYLSEDELNNGLDDLWTAMKTCAEQGLKTTGVLPGKLNIKRRAHDLYQQLQGNAKGTLMNDWLCAYAMAVNEENAAGHMVVTAPTNGAAGVLPAVLYYFFKQENATIEQIREFLLVAGAIGGIIKHNSSISGAEVGCQGEVGSAASMAASALCHVLGGNSKQIENAAEIALEHHLGMTCDPVAGLVQVPCIERNGFGAIKAYTAASLALRGDGSHFMPLDQCIHAMKETGLAMSSKYKETSLGGLAVSMIEC